MMPLAPPTSKDSETPALAAMAARTFAAHCDGLSSLETGTRRVKSPPNTLAVTTTFALPAAVIVPLAVAVSTCATL